MNEKDFEKAAGTNSGEIVAVFMAIINAMRSQSTFDDKKFQQDIKTLIKAPKGTALQKEILSRLIK